MTRDAAKSYDHFKKIIGEDEVKELSTKTLGNYISKASDASKHRGLPIRKVDNRYSGVSKASKKLDQRESVDKEELDEAPKMKYALVGKDMKIYSMGSDERDLRLDRRSLEKRFKNVAPLKMARLKTAQSIGDKVDKSQLKEEVEIDEGMMKNMAIDLKDLPSDEFQRKYNMSKADAERKYGKPESVQIDEVKIPPYKEVMKVIGHTKNAVEGRAALKKKYGVTDKQADEIIRSTILGEKTLTPAEKKKREEVAQAIQRDNPDMPMDKKMAIATATAKKVAEETLIEADAIDTLQKAAKSRSPMRIKFDSGTSENIDKQTAEQLLDVHKKLNSSNKKRFEQNLFKSSLDFMKMVDFAVKKAG